MPLEASCYVFRAEASDDKRKITNKRESGYDDQVDSSQIVLPNAKNIYC